jgi:hypothetical protein
MVFVELRGQFTLANYRSEIKAVIERTHPDEKGCLCAYVVSRDLTRVLYGFFHSQPNATQGLGAIAKQMGEDAAYASMFDMHLPDQKIVLKGLVYV